MKQLIRIIGISGLCIITNSNLFGQFGDLPKEKSILTAEMSGVKGEIALFFASNELPSDKLKSFDFEKWSKDDLNFVNVFGVAEIDSFRILGSKKFKKIKVAMWWMLIRGELDIGNGKVKANDKWIGVKTWFSDRETVDFIERMV